MGLFVGVEYYEMYRGQQKSGLLSASPLDFLSLGVAVCSKGTAKAGFKHLSD
jgi:hypothetical protein